MQRLSVTGSIVCRALAERRTGDAVAASRRALSQPCVTADERFLHVVALVADERCDDAAAAFTGLPHDDEDGDHPVSVVVGLLEATGFGGHVEPLAAALIRARPDDPHLRVVLAERALGLNDPDTAFALARDATALAPHSAAAWIALGMAAFERGDAEEAVLAFARATVAAPGAAAAWSDLGMALKAAGRLAEARDAHDRAVALAPDLPRVRLNRCVTLLTAGCWAEAWPDFEQRRALSPTTQCRGDLPRSLQDTRLDGRRVLLTHEEGFGDTIQFLRYAPLLAARGARVAAVVPPELARVVAASAGIAEVCTRVEAAAEFDHVWPFTSLPGAFGTTPHSVPPPAPLAIDPALIETWSARLPTSFALRIGLCWAGQDRPWQPGFVALNRRRNACLAELGPLARVPDARFVSLQRDRGVEPYPAELNLHDPMPDVADFYDTAAIVAALDAVVSVDTAVAHLAATVGTPVLLLDRRDGCWRWLRGRDDSPWYSSIRILRQEVAGDWRRPVERAASLLATWPLMS